MNDSSAADPRVPAPGELPRRLGTFDSAMIVAGSIIGVGIFVTPGLVAFRLPSPGLIYLVWAVGGAIALCGALAYAELGTRMPEAGGQYVYLREAYHPIAGFLYGWVALLIVATGALAVLALSFVDYLGALIPIPTGGRIPLAIAALIVLSAINYVGIKPGSGVQNFLTLAKIAGIGALVMAAIFLGGSEAPSSPSAAIVVERSQTGPGMGLPFGVAFGAGLVGVLFSFGGWQQVNFVAGEVRDPRRALPKALIAGVGVVVLVYLGANFAYLSQLTPAQMIVSQRVAADTAVALLGAVGGRMVTVLIIASILGVANAIIMTVPRVYYAMARDDLFFRWAGDLHPRFRTPARAIVLQTGWACVLLFVSDIGTLIEGVVFADWIFFGLTVGAVVVFRLRGLPAGDGVYRVPGYPAVPVFFMIAAAFVVGSSIVSAPLPSAYGAGLLALGAIVYSVWRRRSRGAGGARGARGPANPVR